MGYADLAAARAELGLSGNEPDDTDANAMLATFDDALTLRFNDATGMAWGTYADETRTIEAYGVSNWLLLPAPLTTLTSVEVDGNWNGTDWDDGATVDTSYLRLVVGGNAIENRAGFWYGSVRVTGSWGDEVNDDPPADVVAALTEAVVAEYRRRTFNARDTTASFNDLEAVPPPRAENGPLWKAAILTHRTKTLVIA